MNIDTICQQLREMRLTHMANQLVDRIANGDHIDLPHEQFIGLLVEDEYLYRQKRRLNRMITNARFKPEQPSIEDITYSNKRRLMKKDIMQFTTTQWIDNTQNLILTGKTGCGKSFIAQAVALQACRMGYPALNIRYNMLFEEVNAARGTGLYLKFLQKIAKIGHKLSIILVLDL